MMKPLTEVDFEIHILQDKERIKSFDCDDDDLNDFILNTAPLYKSAMLAETFVVEDQHGKVSLVQSDEQDQHTRLLFFDMKRFISFT